MPILQFSLLKLSFLLFVFIFLILPKSANAFYDATSNSCYGADGSCTLEKANVCKENGKGSVPAAQCIRSGPDIWTLNYPVCRVCVDVDPDTGEAACDFRNYEYTTATCSAVDRCYGSSVGGTGYDASGRVIPGLCVESAFNPAIGPSSACPSGGHYKQCCSSGGYYPTTACSQGRCDDGQITAAGTTFCNSAPAPPPPPPTNFCAEAGYEACTPGSVVGSCINGSGQTCTAYSTYACNFQGQNYCDPNI